MTKEEKTLLLQDLCGRLAYKIKGLHREQVHTVTNIEPNSINPIIKVDGYDAWFPIEMFKPYLRSMSSMTEDERAEYRKLGGVMSYDPEHDTWAMCAFAPEAYDWLNKKMFDYRGLIPKGLALETPAEPNFKVGDWVVDKHYSKTYQVFSIDNSEHNYYIVYSCKPLFNTDSDWPCFCEDMIRPWTIQDADDGDVLEFGDHGRLVVGIVSYINKTTGKVDVNCLLENNNFKVGNYYNLDTIKPHPATEEQCDLLFQKMKDAGYEWDDEKMELKKIEQTSAWSEEDEKMWLQVINEMEAIKANSSTIFEKNIAQDKIDWLKSLKSQNRLKSSEVKNETKNKCPNYSEGYGCSTSPLKQCDICPDYKLYNHWKPSEEQMEALDKAKNSPANYYDIRLGLQSLYNDLKKL